MTQRGKNGRARFEHTMKPTLPRQLRRWSIRVTLAFALIAPVQCSSAKGPSGASRFELPADEPLIWVNPARCLASCTNLPADLVEVDLVGRPQRGSGRRVRAVARPAIEALLSEAKRAGFAMTIVSAFRTFGDQIEMWNQMIDEPGRAALPGHSEHQLGTTIDIDTIDLQGERWLAQHAAEFGFTLSYRDGEQRLTGFREEPWHVRFVGQKLARELSSGGMSLETYFRAHPQTAASSGQCADCPSPIARRPCGTVTSGGECQRNVLTWCYEGSLAMVDCSTSQRFCRVVGDKADCRSTP
ncbi:MAG: M15 family metallopeptidase [Polyangiaceae bacterium]